MIEKKKLSSLENVGLLVISLIISMTILSFIIGSFIVFPASQVQYSPPTPTNPLGTDDIGDDVLTLLLRGSRVSLTIGLLGALVSTAIGGMLGVISGFIRGVIDEALSGMVDLFLVIPALPLMIVFAAYLSPSFWNVVLVIGLLWWPTTARLVRARTRQLRGSLFVEGLKGIGARNTYVMFRHILPNVGGIIRARFILAVSHSILLEAGLSFIGLGDPVNQSWGMMLHFAMTRGALFHGAWWTFVPPGICISLTALGFMLLGMGLEQRQRLRARKIGDMV